MHEVSEMLAQSWPVLGLLMVAVVLVVVLLCRQGRALHSQEARTRELARWMDERLDVLADEVGADREEISRGIRGMSDSVVGLMGEMSRVQQGQMDAFGAQIRASHQSDEERMERMRQGMEARLESYDRQVARVGQTLDEKLAQNERRLEDMRRTMETAMQRLQGENEKKLEQIRATVDEKLNTTLNQRLGESFRTVSDRLEQVYKGLGEMQTLAAGVGDLKKVLTGVKTRGIWGEVQLGALLEQALAPDQYEANCAVCPGSTERVEYAIRLPGRGEDDAPVYLPIDAKFPAEDYNRLLEATEAADKQAVDAAGKALEQTIRLEAKRIHDKYIAPPHTTDFAIMFLPVEGLFAEVLRRGGIVEKLQREYRVSITGPTTLLALLSSLQMGFRTVAIERRSSEVWALLGAVKTEFGRFADLLGKTQQRLRQASDSIEVATRKTRTIERKLKNVEALSVHAAQQMIDLEDEVEVLALPGQEELDDL